jgi:DNA (cytosine-5)-methyltransferase 1
MTAFIDLFSGIGGFALGAYWAGLRFDKHYYSEIDPYACKVYRQRFPDAIPLGDITKIDGRDLEKADYIMAGGFPCQDLSQAGRKAGLDGERSGLYKEYIRLLRDIRPKFAVMENVAAIFNFDIGRLFGDVSESWYNCEWQIISASALGYPHERKRFFMVLYPESLGRISVYENAEYEALKNRMVVQGGGGGNWKAEWLQESIHLQSIDYGNTDETMGSMWGDSDGIPAWLDRLKGIGNSIIPEIAELIFKQEAFDEWRKSRHE